MLYTSIAASNLFSIFTLNLLDMPVIYKIVNMVNGFLYVGSAVSEGQRKRRHFTDLKNNCHHSRYLQRAFNKYGIASFTFSVIEIVEEKNNLIKREQHWLDTLKPQYNISPTAGNSFGVKHTKEFVLNNKLRNSGFGNGNARITESQMMDIIELRKQLTEAEIAKKYNVHRTTIQRVLKRNNIKCSKFYSVEMRKKLGVIGLKNLPNKSKIKN